MVRYRVPEFYRENTDLRPYLRQSHLLLRSEGFDTVQSATSVLEDVDACHHGPEEHPEGI